MESSPPSPPTSTAPPTTSTPPSTFGPTECAFFDKQPTWYQDTFCDDELNTPECNYDGGDCCVQRNEDWHKYCTACDCIGMDCPSIKKWWGNGRKCDGKWNNAGCFYDGGDCCQNNWQINNKCNDEFAASKLGMSGGVYNVHVSFDVEFGQIKRL